MSAKGAGGSRRLVLSHDVESVSGTVRREELLDFALGFDSSTKLGCDSERVLVREADGIV